MYANDFDRTKQAIYAARFPNHEDLDSRNLFDVSASELPKPVDLIAASFPCIDLSLAGNRKGLAGDHSGAFWAFVQILEQLRDEGALPPMLMIENVVGFLTSNRGEDFRTAIRTLNELGYRVDVVQVSAENFTPQSRPRLFVLGIREDLAHLAMLLPDQLDADVWDSAVRAAPDIRPKRVCTLMTGRDEEGQARLIEEQDTFAWGVVQFPELPTRNQSFTDVVDWSDDSWWSEERTAKALSEMNPLHQLRVRELIARDGRQAATAYRRRRNGRSVYEVRSDGVAGCLRTARGGSSTQIVVAAENGEVRMRWMNPREYARLQGCEYQESLDAFGDSDLKTAFGDAVCVPTVRWVAQHAFGTLMEFVDAPGQVAQMTEVEA